MQSQKSRLLALSALFLALTLVIQLSGLPMPVMGPLVNGILLLSSVILGLLPALLLGTLTPVIALIRGYLPPFLAVLIPFIVVANGILVTTFTLISKVIPNPSDRIFSIQMIASISLAAVLKTAFLFVSIRVLVPVWFGMAIPDQIALMMTTPQFLTAMAGGLIALFGIRLFSKRGFL